uniref:Uncharacterized protein n=1 Tax=Panagrolaimus sp. JU765 TaxID=591449 RepID=A0AC34Q2M1_9BILA
MYFTFWKSYDLLWFWMHFLLCICFKPLRPENYLLVWINLMRNKQENPQKSYRQIYNMLYNKRFTKSERELKKMETEDEGNGGDSDDENDNGNGTRQVSLFIGLNLDFYLGGEKPKVQIKLNKENTENDALIEVGKAGPSNSTENNDEDKKSGPSKLLQKAIPGILKKSKNLGDSPDESKNFIEKIGQKLIPEKFQRSASNDGSVTDEQEKLEKQRKKEAKRAEKERQKEVRRQRKIELRRLAAIERRRKNIADSIDLMLQCLRSFCAFAILVGNIHRHFMPLSPFVNPNESAYNNPDLLMLFTVTMSLDVFLFWITLILTYCRQCRLCCRLGLCRFWLWLIILLALLIGVMYSPMHYIHQQLDPTWCLFMPGTDLAEYLKG